MTQETKTLSQITHVTNITSVATVVGVNNSDQDILVPVNLITDPVKAYADTKDTTLHTTITTEVAAAIAAAIAAIPPTSGAAPVLILSMVGTGPIPFASYNNTSAGNWVITPKSTSVDASYNAGLKHVTVNTPGIYKVSIIAKIANYTSDGSTNTTWPMDNQFNVGTRLGGTTSVPVGMEKSIHSIPAKITDEADPAKPLFHQWSDDYLIEITAAGESFLPSIYWDAYDPSTLNALCNISVFIQKVA